MFDRRPRIRMLIGVSYPPVLGSRPDEMLKDCLFRRRSQNGDSQEENERQAEG